MDREKGGECREWQTKVGWREMEWREPSYCGHKGIRQGKRGAGGFRG